MTRPTYKPRPMQAAILAYRAAHPEATHEQIATATGAALKYVVQVLSQVNGERIGVRVLRYLTEHPGTLAAHVAKALDLGPTQVASAMQELRAEGLIPEAAPVRVRVTDEQRRAMLPMLPGVGDRRDDCVRYPEHVDRAGTATHGEAHCPSTCPQYQKRPREYDRAAAMMAREASSYAMHVRT